MKLTNEQQEFWELLHLKREVDECGIIRWVNAEGELHRLSGPAVIYPSGTAQFFKNGLRHRLNGPAIIFASGAKYWYLNGERHRDDQPAVIFADGTEKFYKNGKEVPPF